jgi:excisionase family DNA binding protein
MDAELQRLLSGLTLTVEQAGRALGIGRNAAYAAVKRGDIPTLKIGGAIRVPAAPLRRMLGLGHGEAA